MSLVKAGRPARHHVAAQKKRKRGRRVPPTPRRAQPERAHVRETHDEIARQTWNALPESEKEAILHEIVHTRAVDLQRAYPDILAIGYGMRTRYSGARRRRRLPELTLKFLVKKKWAGKPTKAASKRALPRELHAYCGAPDGRALCIVPTDIDHSVSYKNCRPQVGPRLVAASPSGQPTVSELGSIACIVNIPGGGDTPYALSAAHVFDLTAQTWPGLPSNVGVTDSVSQEPFAQVTDFAGPIQSSSDGLSFDAALAQVSDASALANVMDMPRPLQCIGSAAQLPATYMISTSHGKLIATKGTVWKNQILTYQINNGTTVDVQHDTLIESDAQTQPGDSGAPVVTNDQQTLLGMNIYGGEGVCFMIPAFCLIKSENYSGLPAGQLLKLV
ncbi:MAG TPA: trypsin-like serine protease [Steroidobacteraceae bacterium]|nr:trypsin-like serine protease [Steroidobacteraceae bacterium]